MIPMVPYRCYKCGNWLRELTVEKLDHNYMEVYLCMDCKRGYEVDDNDKSLFSVFFRESENDII